MKKPILLATILVASCGLSHAADSASSAPKGTICYSNSLRSTTNPQVTCKDLGIFPSIAAIYERGYRVVASGHIPGPENLAYFIVEERK